VTVYKAHLPLTATFICEQERGKNELTYAQKFADVVDNLARRRDVVLVAYKHDLFRRKHSQPVGDEWVIHPNPQPNLHIVNSQTDEAVSNCCRQHRLVCSRGFTTMHYINRRFTYLLTYFYTYVEEWTSDFIMTLECCRRPH